MEAFIFYNLIKIQFIVKMHLIQSSIYAILVLTATTDAQGLNQVYNPKAILNFKRQNYDVLKIARLHEQEIELRERTYKSIMR